MNTWPTKHDDLRNIRSGVFNALLLRDTLDRLEADGISVGAGLGDQAAVSPLARDFSPRIRAEAERMQLVYVLFFSLENAVRELIAQRLAERHGAGWWDTHVPRRIRDNVTTLREREARNRYHATRAPNPIGYTTFGQLAQVIISAWDDFSDLFPDQSWVTSRFNDLEMSRNIIMHSNVLPDIEIERIDSLVRDWFRQVG